MSAQTYKDLLNQGLAAHQLGHIEDALTAYRCAIDLEPQDAEVASLMGLALSQSAWAEHAMGFLARAVQLEPEQLPFRMNLVEGLEHLGQIDRARQEIRAVIVRDPGHVRAWEKSGDLAELAGDMDAAVAAWTQARMLAPDEPTPALKIARFKAQRGEPDQAHEILDKLAERLPDDGRLLAVRCEILAHQHRWAEHAATIGNWLRLHPADANAWRELSRQHFAAGHHREAANAYGRVLALRPPNAPDYTAFAALCLQALDVSAAQGALEQAARLSPDYPELLATRGLLCLYIGRFAEAESDCLRCLELDPTNASAITTLSRVRRGHLTESELTGVRRFLADKRLPLDRRLTAAFAVAHALDARHEYSAAFSAYQAAHELARERDHLEARRFDADQLNQRRLRILALDPPAFMSPPPSAPQPIFVVGMPRSGTTLVEAILAAHPEVFGCGERSAMPPIVAALLALPGEQRGIAESLMQDYRASYLAGLPSLGSATRFTDKQPFNFEAISLIDKLFPGAAVVYVRRDPIETCLSIYQQEFNKAWSFTHSLGDIAAVYAHHAQLMQAWEKRFPNRIVTIQYEHLVADFTTAARSLVAACGLDWNPRCLEFQSVARPIATLSAVEARDPVKSRNGRVANYRAELASMTDTLTRLKIDLATGALIAG